MNLPFEKVTPEHFDTLYQVNIRSPFFLTQAVLPALIHSGGAVVNISSIHAFEGYPGHSVYAGTKGAIVAYTRELAIELALKGVRVNAVAPGAIAVESHYALDPGYDPRANGNAEQLTHSEPAVLNYHPTPSPDGEHLIIGSTRSGVRQLYIMKDDGSDI